MSQKRNKKNSLFVYVWHGFFVKAAIYFGLIHMLSNISNTFALTILFITALIITALLSSQLIAAQTEKTSITTFSKVNFKKNIIFQQL